MIQDVAALIVDSLKQFKEYRVPESWVELHEFAMNAVDLKRYESMEKDKIPPNVYRDLFTSPTKFNDAWNHPDPWQRLKWREAIIKEFEKMEKLKVWKKIKRNQMPKGRRCVKHKWIFEIKRNGIFRARLVACGYSQVPGVDFTESYAPVVNDITVRLLLIVLMVWKFHSAIADVETAFLHGILKGGEEIFMDCPKEWNVKTTNVLCLKRRFTDWFKVLERISRSVSES